jgi:hypothetical protein
MHARLAFDLIFDTAVGASCVEDEIKEIMIIKLRKTYSSAQLPSCILEKSSGALGMIYDSISRLCFNKIKRPLAR